MALNFNGTEITDVKFNGTELDVVNMNGTKVFEKVREVTITETVTADALLGSNTNSTKSEPYTKDTFTLSHTPIGGVTLNSGTFYYWVTYSITYVIKKRVQYSPLIPIVMETSVSGNKFSITSFYSGGKDTTVQSNLTKQPTTPKSTVTVTYKYKPE